MQQIKKIKLTYKIGYVVQVLYYMAKKTENGKRSSNKYVHKKQNKPSNSPH